MTFKSAINKPKPKPSGIEYEIGQLDKRYDWLDRRFGQIWNPEDNTVGRKSGKIYKSLSYQEQYFGYEDKTEAEIVNALAIPKPNPPKTVWLRVRGPSKPLTLTFEEGRKFRV